MATRPFPVTTCPSVASLIVWLLQYSHGNYGTSIDLLICASRGHFLQQLQSSVAGTPVLGDSSAIDNENEDEQTSHPLLTNTLLNIAASRNVKLSFVTSVPALLACLSVLPYREGLPVTTSGTPLLVILNLVTLHEDSSAWSAQGVSRTISLAVETAWKARRRLMLVECPEAHQSTGRDSSAPDDSSTSMADNENDDATMPGQRGMERPARGLGDHGDDDADARADARSPWNRLVPIVTPGTRAFGAGNNRGWIDKKVRVADIVGRWCIFGRLPTI